MARAVQERQDVVPLVGEVFRAHGYEGASLARISAGTGLGKGSLYHFFPGGKEEMAEAVLGHVQAWFEANVFRPLETEAPGTAMARMFDNVSGYFRSGRRICLVGAFALEDTRDRFAGAVSGYFRRWIVALAGALERAGHDPETARRKAEEVVAGIQGAIVLARALNDPDCFAGILARLAAGCRNDG